MTLSDGPISTRAHRGLDGKVTVFGYLFLCLNVFFLTYLLAIKPYSYFTRNMEGGWIESLTAVWFLLAGLLLFATARVEPNFFRRCLYILGGTVMVFVTGEELSWGQHILGFSTPVWLMDLNTQGEFNVHNTNLIIFSLISREAVLLLHMVTALLFFFRKYRLLGIPLPSIPLMLSLLVTLSYSGYGGFSVPIAQYLSFYERKVLVLFFAMLFAVYTLFSKQGRLFIITVATIVLFLAVAYVYYYHSFTYQREVHEYLLGIVCLLYALELLLAQGGGGRSDLLNIYRNPKLPIALPLGLLKPLSLLPWLTMCALIIAGSIGMVFTEYFTSKYESRIAKEKYQQITSGKFNGLVVRSDFDVYISENTLYYVKEPCTAKDIDTPFFVHFFPLDNNDLSWSRKKHGFNNLGFNVGLNNSSVRFDKKCIIKVPLPDYTVDRISTGQFSPGSQIWRADFYFDNNLKRDERH